MKRRIMIAVLAGALGLSLLAGCGKKTDEPVSPDVVDPEGMTVEQESGVSLEERYKGYAEILRERESAYGKVEAVRSFVVYLTGTCYADLIDFDGDGNEEFLVAHEEAITPSSYAKFHSMEPEEYNYDDETIEDMRGTRGQLYSIEVWGYVGDELTKLYEEPASYVHEGGNIYFGLVRDGAETLFEKRYHENKLSIYGFVGDGFEKYETLEGDLYDLDDDCEWRIDGQPANKAEVLQEQESLEMNTTYYYLNGYDSSMDVDMTSDNMFRNMEVMFKRFQDIRVKLGFERMEYNLSYDEEVEEEEVTEEEKPEKEETPEEEEQKQKPVKSHSADELCDAVVNHYTSKWAPDGEYICSDHDFQETDTQYILVLRYAMSDEEAENIIANGGSPVANKYVTTVYIDKKTGMAEDESGDPCWQAFR